VVEHGAVVAPNARDKKLSKHLATVSQVFLDNMGMDGGMKESDLIDAAVAATPIIAGKRDRRRDQLRVALDTLTTMGELKRVAPGRVVSVAAEEEEEEE
jgi:hypothetical protein